LNASNNLKTSVLDAKLSGDEKELLAGLDTPPRLQAFLDELTYPAGERNRSPLTVLRERQAHCLDGGLFAAMVMRSMGYPPLLVDILPEAGQDDDHILVVFKVAGSWGAVAKSNYVGLRYREPVYRSLRELVMSYFDVFFNVNGLRTLRSYTRPVNLQRFQALNWEVEDSTADWIEKYLKKLKPISLLSPGQAEKLSVVDSISMKAGLMMANPEGLYQPAG
jgi:hypothetical protein